MKPIAIIPARGGSKRILRKNIKLFLGKPIIGYAIEAATESNLFSKIIVSTDDEDISKVAVSFGASCEWLRSERLAYDSTSTLDVIQDAVQKMQSEKFEFACCIYPTTPLLKSFHLKSGLSLLESGNWDYIFAAQLVSNNVYRSFYKKENDKIQLLFPENELIGTQQLPEMYTDAGQFYWGKREAWESGLPILSSNTSILPMGFREVIDINTEDDWKLAEQMYLERNLN
jgi:pseudaminic acid cytidylyltransferase